MTPIKTYASQLDADLARIKLEGAGITAVVVGVGVVLQGGTSGVQLMVPDEQAAAARAVLEDA
jgi:hypothetical protein